MTGIWLVRRRSPSTSSPLRAGSITSSSTRSGFSLATISRAVWPSSASRTSYPSSCNRRDRSLRSIGSSSTTRTVHGPIRVSSLPGARRSPHGKVIGHHHVGLRRGQVDHGTNLVRQLPLDHESRIWWGGHPLHAPPLP